MNAGWCANSKMPPMHVYVWMSYVPNDISYRSFVLLLLSQETHHATYIRTRKIGRSSYPPCSCVDEAIVKSESKACLEGEEWASGISSILYPLSLIVTHSPPPPSLSTSFDSSSWQWISSWPHKMTKQYAHTLYFIVCFVWIHHSTFSNPSDEDGFLLCLYIISEFALIIY